MKITDVETTPVVIPFEAPVRWSFGVRNGTTRTIVKVHTDEGITGIGETYGGEATALGIEKLKGLVIGEDPFKIEHILSKFDVSGGGHLPTAHSMYFAALEMACWDIMGKALDAPVCKLIGGKNRDKIPTGSIVYYRYEGEDGVGGESTPQDIADYTSNLMDEYGLDTFKIKIGVFKPETEIQTIDETYETVGEKANLRADPNAVWTVGTSIQVLKKLKKYNLEYFEDPARNLKGMKEVRKKVNVPLATNMCVLWFDQIPPAIEMGAIDVMLSDLFQWGGIMNSKKLAAISETFQLGLGMHNNAILGVSLAASLHFAAATPYLTHPIDSHYHHYTDDIISNPFEYEDGSFPVPEGPGLGVELDEEKVEKYAELCKEKGEARHTFDPNRPDWVPSRPLW